MNTTIALTLPVPPSVNAYWRKYRNRIVVSEAGQAYKLAVAGICRCQQIETLHGEVAVTVRVYRKEKRGDTDNYLKVLLDALKGFTYQDDKQITEIHIYRFDDRTNPRAEVEVKDLEWKLL